MTTRVSETRIGGRAGRRLEDAAKLSDLMTLAINDLESVTGQTGVGADMVFWGEGRIHEVLQVGDETDRKNENTVETGGDGPGPGGDTDEPKCTVCLAGAVMVCEGLYPHEPYKLHRKGSLSPTAVGRLDAVDLLRRGKVAAAMDAMRLHGGIPMTHRLKLWALLRDRRNRFRKPGPLGRRDTLEAAA